MKPICVSGRDGGGIISICGRFGKFKPEAGTDADLNPCGVSTVRMSGAQATQPTGFKSKQVVEDELLVCLGLARTYQLPAIYESADATQIQKALTLGADALAAVREIEDAAGSAAAATGAQVRAVKAAEEKAAKTAWKLEQDVERLRREREEAAEEAAKLRAEFAGLQASFQDRLEVARQGAAADADRRAVTLESKLEGLQEAFKMMREAEEERMGRLLAGEAARRAELLEAKEAMITVLKADKAAAATELAAAQEALAARRGAKANSAIKGQLGEEEFADLAAGQGWGLERTAKESRSCDYRGDIAGMPVFFEIKAHERRVATAEVDKFKRDMNEHPEVGAGVFLALHTGIVGARGGATFWTEYTGDGRLLIFLSDVLSAGEEAARMHLAAIHQLLTVAVQINKARLAGEGDKLEEYKGRVDAAEKYIVGIKERMRVLINTLHNDRRTLVGSLQASYERLGSIIRSIQTDVNITLGALLGEAAKFDEDLGEVGIIADETEVPGSVVAEVLAMSPTTAKKRGGSKKVATPKI